MNDGPNTEGNEDELAPDVNFAWDKTPAPPLSLEVRVPRSVFFYFKGWTMDDILKTWPLSNGYTEEDSRDLLDGIMRVTSQPYREDGDCVVLTEWYHPAASGFPGSLHSRGLQGLKCAVRSNFLLETADMDMSSAQNRCIRFWCHHFGIPVPHLDHILLHYGGEQSMLQRLVEEMNITKDKAKSLIISAWTGKESLRTDNRTLQKIDQEAKRARSALMERPELQFILPYCGVDNRPGSFIAKLYHFTVSKLLLRVKDMLAGEYGVACATLIFDGLNITDKSLHGNQAILDRAQAVCNEIFPGIDMIWAWKSLDFKVKTKDKIVLKNADGSDKELRVPLDFVPPSHSSGLSDLDDDEVAAAAEAAEAMLVEA
jgi:hypothetical protein